MPGLHSIPIWKDRRYAWPILFIALAVAVRLALDPLLGASQPLVIVLLAVLLTARVAGRGPALLATALGVLAAWFFFLEPRLSPWVADPREFGSLALLALTGAGISVYSDPAIRDAASAPEEGGNIALFRRVGLMVGTVSLLLAMTAMLYSDFERESRQQTSVAHTYEILNHSRSLLTILVDAETGQRGYLLTGDPRYLEPYQSALAAEREQRALVRRLTGENPDQRARMDQLDQLVPAKLAEMHQVVALYDEAGTQAALARLRTGEGKRTMDAIRSVLRALEDEERRVLEQRSSEAAQQGLRVRWVLGLGSGSLILILMIAGAIIERDIQIRDAAKRALRESEQQFRTLANAIPQLCSIADADGSSLWYNQRWYEYTGLTPEQMKHSGWHSVHDPKVLPEVLAEWNHSLESGEPFEKIFPVRGADGEFRPFLTRVVPLQGPDGRIVRWFGTCTDISAQLKVEEELRKSRAQLQGALAAMTDAVFISDSQARFVEINQAFAAFHRFPSKDQCAQTLEEYPALLEVFLADGTPAPLPLWAVSRALRGETASNAEYRLRRRDTGESWVGSYNFAPIRNQEGAIVGSVVVGRDITDRKRAEEALRSSEEGFRRIFENAPIGILITDGDGNIEECNAALCRLLGFGPEELRGTPFSARLSAEGRPSWVAQNETSLQGRGDICLVRKDGQPVWVTPDSCLLAREAGAPPRTLLMLTDITDRKRAEEAIHLRERTLHRFIESAPVAIAMFDHEMRYLAASRRYRADFGLGDQDLIARSYYEVFPGSPERWREVHQRCLAGATLTNSGDRFLRADGTQQWLRWEARPWRLDGEGAVGGLIFYSEDITLQKEAEQALRDSEKQFRTLANAIPQLCWMAHSDGSIFWYNERWYQYTGTTPEAMEGWGWQSVHDPEILPSVLERWKDSLASSKSFEMVFPLRGADGEFRPFLTRIVPVYDREGNVVRWFGTNTDITEQRRVEDALRESEGRFQLFMDNSPTIAWIKNERSELVYVSRTYERQLGVRPEDWLGKSDDQLWPAAVAQQFRKNDLAVLESGQAFEAIEETIDADGRRRSWLNSKFTFRDGAGNRYVCGVGLDVTERRRVDEALRASEERFRKVFENVGTGMVIADQDGRLERCNAAFCRMLGYSEEELQGIPLDSLKPLEERDTSRAELSRLRSGEISFYQSDGRYLKKTGETVWVNRFVSILPDSYSRVDHVIGMVTDITARKEAEQRILQLNAELEKRVDERTAELQAANKELEAFAYSVSHDLRAPLRGIDGWSLALQEEYETQLDSQAHEYLHRVRSETQRMGDLIDDLLKLSRVTRAEMQRQMVDLSLLAHRVAERLQESHRDRGIALTIASGLKAEGDARLLELALTNLFDNAVKFTGRRALAEIEFGQTVANGAPAFYLRDNGAGFDMAHAGSLFGAFQRLHKSSEFAGSGVGLATVQRIIGRHGGMIWAEAEVDRGAVFYFTIGAIK